MGKLLVLLLGLLVVAGGAYYYLEASARTAQPGGEPSTPSRQLDNVRGAAQHAEDDAQKRADDLMEKTAE